MMDPELFKQKFKTICQNGLPGETAHKILAPINRPLASDVYLDDKSYNLSAVGIILYSGHQSTNCILIKRPDYKGVHANQISFPGGKMDEGDHDLEFTARREVNEEISLDLSSDQRIGQLSHLYIPVSKFKVSPYVYYIEDIPPLVPDAREVASIIHFDVFELLNENVIKTTDIRVAEGLIRKNIPYFDIDGHIVWGATAMMLAELKSVLEKF